MISRPAYRTLALVLALAPSALAQRTISPIATLAPPSATSDPTVTLAAPIVIDRAALEDAAADPGMLMRLALPDAPGIDVSFVRFVRASADTYTAMGRSARGDTVFLAQRAGVVAADILTGDGFTYQIRTTPGGAAEIRRMNQAQFDPCGCNGGEDALELRPVPRELRSLVPAPGARPTTVRGGAACNEDGSVIDLLVAYTDAAAAAQGGTANMLAVIDLALMEGNQSLANSNVPTTIRLAGAVEVPKTWSTNSSASILGFMSEPDDGSLDELQGLRDQYHADLVSLIVASLDVCGRGYYAVWPGPTPVPELGFNVVGHACATAPTYALIHEVGHNVGLGHDRGDDPCDARVTSYAHGYVDPTDAFETILGVTGSGPRIPYLSNPSVDYNAMPTGIADDADNAAAFIVGAGIVAKFRSLDCNSNGICDADDILLGTSLDCDGNGVPDECDPDLNGNGLPDACDIANATSLDTNLDGIPDEAEPARIYVDPLATGTGLGGSWTDARSDLQTALSIAERSGGLVQEVWVVEGVYTPAPSPQRARRFQLVSGVAIYGGFAGGETDLSQRDWRAHPTILSGDLLGDDGPDFTNIDDNSTSVVSVSYTDNTASLDGFFIQGGNCNFTTASCYVTLFRGGAGIYSWSGDAVFRNCVIRDNTANNGAGIHIVVDGSPDFFGCDFIHNKAVGGPTNTSGGAAYLSCSDGTFCIFRNCRFLGNLSEGSSAGVTNICQDGPFENCLFAGNVCDDGRGGGMSNSGSCGSSPTCTNCTFVGNYASDGGAGMYTGIGHPTLANCLFWGNSYGTGWTYEWAAYASNQGPLGVTFINCSVQRWSGYYTDSPGTNDLNPMFVDADGPDDIYGTEDDDPTLMPGSPAIDSGDNDSAAGLLTDLAGHPRFADDPATLDSGSPVADAPYVDRGVYEVQAPPSACAGDLDGDGDTDVFDFAMLAANFSSSVTPGTNGDLDGSGAVDVFDFAILAADFSCTP